MFSLILIVIFTNSINNNDGPIINLLALQMIKCEIKHHNLNVSSPERVKGYQAEPR